MSSSRGWIREEETARTHALRIDVEHGNRNALMSCPVNEAIFVESVGGENGHGVSLEAEEASTTRRREG